MGGLDRSWRTRVVPMHPWRDRGWGRPCPAAQRGLQGLWLVIALAFGAAVQAAEVRIAFGQSLAPFADEETGRGVEIDIIRAALQAAGHRLVPGFMPQARVPLALADRQFDGAATLTSDSGVVAAYSGVYIEYLDIVVARQGALVAPLRLPDLAPLRVVGFQNASKYLGPAFAAMVAANPHYTEQANQLSQLRMLFGGQADAIVVEQRIYAHQLKKLQASRFTERPFAVDLFRPFASIPYRVAFRDAALRDQFDAGLARLRKDGSLARLEAAYLPTGGARP